MNTKRGGKFVGRKGPEWIVIIQKKFSPRRNLVRKGLKLQLQERESTRGKKKPAKTTPVRQGHHKEVSLEKSEDE